MKFLKYLFPMLLIFIVTIFVVDKKFLQSYNYEKLKIDRETFALNATKDDPIVIGVVWSYEGKETDNDNDNFREGVEFAIDEINANGGVLNRKIEAIFKDDEMGIDNSVNIAKSFALNEKVMAVIAHAFSNFAIHSSIVYDYSGIVMISPGASDPLFTRNDFNYIFRTVPSDIDAGNAISRVAKLQNFRKIVVLNDKSTYATTIANVVIEKSLELGLEVIYKAKFNEDEHFFTEILTNLSPQTNYNIDYDAIVAIGTDENIPLLIKKARAKGIYAPFITTDMLDLKNILNLGDFLNDTIVATMFNAEALNIKTQNFLEKFKQKYNFYPDTWAAQGYDSIMLLAEAIKRTKSTNPSSIAENLKYIKNFDSIFGTYSMTPRGDVQGRKTYFKQINDGKFKYLDLD